MNDPFREPYPRSPDPKPIKPKREPMSNDRANSLMIFGGIITFIVALTVLLVRCQSGYTRCAEACRISGVPMKIEDGGWSCQCEWPTAPSAIPTASGSAQ